MSVFSRRKKFHNLVSSAISAVVLSSCASQVAQCWPSYARFNPTDNTILFTKQDENTGIINNIIFELNDLEDENKPITFKNFDGIVDWKKFLPFLFNREGEDTIDELYESLDSYLKTFKYFSEYHRDVKNFNGSDNLRCALDLYRSKEGTYELLSLHSIIAKAYYESEGGKQKELIKSLRDLSEKIKKLYNSSKYRVEEIVIDRETNTVIVLTEGAEGWQPYTNNYKKVFRSYKFADHLSSTIKNVKVGSYKVEFCSFKDKDKLCGKYGFRSWDDYKRCRCFKFSISGQLLSFFDAKYIAYKEAKKMEDSENDCGAYRSGDLVDVDTELDNDPEFNKYNFDFIDGHNKRIRSFFGQQKK